MNVVYFDNGSNRCETISSCMPQNISQASVPFNPSISHIRCKGDRAITTCDAYTTPGYDLLPEDFSHQQDEFDANYSTVKYDLNNNAQR